MRRHAHRSDDQHDRFTAWLEAGTAEDPPRDAAVHAVHCARCRAAMTVLDDLLGVDAGQAPLPPSRVAAAGRASWERRRRVIATAASVVVVVASGAWVAFGVIAPAPTGGTAEASAEQGVLGQRGDGPSAPSPVAAKESPAASRPTSEAPSAPEASPSVAVEAVPTVRSHRPTPRPGATVPPTSGGEAQPTASPSPFISPSATVTPGPSSEEPVPASPNPSGDPSGASHSS